MGTPRNVIKKERYILSVDVGSTVIRCHVYDKKAEIRGSSCEQVVPLHPEEGHVELDPDALWKSFISVVKGAVKDAAVQMHQMEALGISTQRATFTTWDRRSGIPFHNFISWQDQRAAALVASWNRSCTLKLIHGLMKVLHFVTRQKRSLAASLIVFSTQHVTFRLVWALKHYKRVAQAVSDGNCCFGTIDTWLLFKLTNGLVHATDYSNASATGIFDTYQMCWSHMLCSLVSLPLSIFPRVENTGHKFGSTDPSIFGIAVPIMSVMADQQAAMFGECCYDVGDVKITMGTGTFMDINTGSAPHTSVNGLYPLVGWKIGSEVVYLAEGNAADTGTAIKWAQALDLFSDVEHTSTMAYSVSDSNGVCFVPSFSGLQAPLNDPKACASFMGLKPSTTKCHLVRAILESVAFRNKQLYETVLRETDIPITKIRVDGGVSSNDFITQLTADLFGRKIERCRHREMSCLGAAFVAGLGTGYWRSCEELKKLRGADALFCPKGAPGDRSASDHARHLERWERALRRSMYWYKQP
ncbi:putative glycerol kinase 5 isoform X2 [Corythoichthys intestinalis]|uniref:putative glycerol kinase 5 isoform X2 n=1 Tax=Corythoichthys intestinalis TaxID=161448 RepID=UPI0025A59085|nr:putative glycerol kinase 5 isoform X2 [Corythoichthys intestinalis]XP_061795740.1 putative glycerol kinase 5 [Nerophis lumbriciformis]